MTQGTSGQIMMRIVTVKSIRGRCARKCLMGLFGRVVGSWVGERVVPRGNTRLIRDDQSEAAMFLLAVTSERTMARIFLSQTKTMEKMKSNIQHVVFNVKVIYL
jgi:hypothetical protein